MFGMERGILFGLCSSFLSCRYSTSFLAIWITLCFVYSHSYASDLGFRFTNWPSWQVVAPGEEVRLSCSTSLSLDSIKWQHNHHFINRVGEDRSNYEFYPRVNKISDHLRVEQFGGRGSQLVLKVMDHEEGFKRQEGLYQCVASVGSIAVTSLPARVQVAFLTPFTDEGSTNLSLKVEEGSVFRVACPRPNSLPEAILHFYKDGHLLNVSHFHEFFVTQPGDLIILNASITSEGVYSCTAFNEVLSQTVYYATHTKVLIKRRHTKNVSVPPRLVSFEPTIKAIVGSEERLLCLTIYGGSSKLLWKKNNTETTQISVSDNAVAMVIHDVSANDGGVYRCHGNNSFGSSYIDVTVIVQEASYIMMGPESHSVSEGTNVTLKCEFGGHPTPAVAWVFNGNLLTSNWNVKLSDNKMKLERIKRGQAGVYQCFGFNPFGAAEGTAFVTVIPKTVTASPLQPDFGSKSNSSEERQLFSMTNIQNTKQMKNKDKHSQNMETDEENSKRKKTKTKNKKYKLKGKMIAPTRPNVTKLSDESVMVTWELNTTEEGLPILFFKVQYRILEGPHQSMDRRWNTIDDDIEPYVKSYEVIGLKAGHLYRFRVLAVYVNNDNQPGLPSKKFLLEKDIKLKRPDKSPEIKSLFPEGKNAVHLMWSYDASTQTAGFIINYREATSAVDYTKVTILGPERRNYTVNHLLPNMPYDFKMSSFNMAGTSDFSERKTYFPAGLNYTNMTWKEDIPASIIPVVRSEPEGMSNHTLYIALGTGLLVLFIIVIISFTVYSLRNTSGEEIVASKFMDTSLRIHRLSTCELRQPVSNGCKCQVPQESQVPLIINKREEEIINRNEPSSLNTYSPTLQVLHNSLGKCSCNFI